MKRLSWVVWVGIIVLTGTYFRVREMDSAPKTDWLVIAQLSVSLLGGILGIFLIRRGSRFGVGARALMAYVIAAFLSVLFSKFRETVIGYWILLAGSSLLMIGLIQRAESVEDLKRIERTWLGVVFLMLLKDTLIGIFSSEAVEIQSEEELFRLGIGLTHANEMGLLATLGFWMSFMNEEVKRPALLWVLRVFFLMVMVLTRARVSMLSFAMAGIVFFWFKFGFRPREGFHLRMILLSSLSMLICAGILALSFQVEWITNAFDYYNRYQNLEEMTSLTGRTEIWQHAAKRIFEGGGPLVFGHGYGVSRLVINEGPEVPSFFASHAHNALIEIALTTGILGILPFAIMVGYSGKWLVRFRVLAQGYSTGFVLRAISIVTVIFVSSVTESYLGMKIGPIAMIYFFYVLALDWRKDLAGNSFDLSYEGTVNGSSRGTGCSE